MISVIVPVYNTERYLPACVESILNQTFSDLEVILVDDGSTDGSGDLCEQYVRMDRRVRTIHQSNRGLSAARNAGMEVAEGEYFYFIDSDDELALDCIGLLSRPLEEKKYDFVIGQVKVVGSEKEYPSLKLDDGEVTGNAEILRHYSHEEYYMMAFNKLCNADFIKRNMLYFKDGIRFEDNVWSFQMALAASSLYVMNEACYIYKIRSGSITTDSTGKDRIITAVPSLTEINKVAEAYRASNYDDVMLVLSWEYRALYILALYNGFKEEYKMLRRLDPRSRRDIIALCKRSNKLFRANAHLLLSPDVGYRLYSSILNRL